MARTPDRRRPHGALPWFLLLLVLGVVAVVYAVLSQTAAYVLVAAVLVATLVGAVLGIALRDAQERVMSVGGVLGEGLRRLGHKLWY